MELKLRFVNKIKQADIKLNGLTVIAGPNSSGKSTIGRTLFSIVKAIANTKNAVDDNNRKLLKKHADSLYSRLKGMKNRIDYSIYDRIPRTSRDFVSQFFNSNNPKVFLMNFAKVLSEQDIVPRQRRLLAEDLDNIQICWENKDNPAASLKTELQFLIESEFMNNFCSMNSETTDVELKSEGNSNSKVSFKVEENKVTKVTRGNTSFISDATYIESPLYIHIADAIIATKTWREIEGRYSSLQMPIAPSHIKDMIEKVVWAAGTPIANDNPISIDISNIIGVKLTYDKTSHQLVYKNGEKSYATINVASGIKSLSIVQLFENTRIIGPNNLLIWDEPENHLHPEWQLVLANKLVNLAKDGVPILITTHSPYFLQAIRYYSSIEKMGKYINYYTSQRDIDNLVEMVDVTNDLTSVFAELADPLNRIMDVIDYKSK